MLKVIVIDDNISTVEMITSLINWRSIDCEICGVAYGGQKGVALISSFKPDIIIADIHMSGLDGLKMIELAKEQSPNSKVIFVSAYDDFNYVKRALQLGACDYLLKPFKPSELEEVAARIARKQKISVLPVTTEAEQESASDSTLVDQMLAYVYAHVSEPISLGVLAEHFHFCTSYISTLIKKESGCNFSSWVVQAKIDYAKKLLRNYSYRVEEIAGLVGYKNYITFYKVFNKMTGLSPREYRNRKEDADLEDQA